MFKELEQNCIHTFQTVAETILFSNFRNALFFTLIHLLEMLSEAKSLAISVSENKKNAQNKLKNKSRYFYVFAITKHRSHIKTLTPQTCSTTKPKWVSKIDFFLKKKEIF